MTNHLPLDANSEITMPSGFTSTAPAKPTPLPEAPAAHRVIDKKFIAVMGALGR